MAPLGEVKGHWQMFECYTFPCPAFVYFNIHTTHCGRNTTLMTYSVLNFVDNLEINEVSMVFMNISKEDGYTHPITLPDKQPHYHNFIISCRESPRAYVAKFYGRLRLICSVLRASKFAVLKLIEIVILWVYYTIPFGFGFFRHFWDIFFSTFSTTFFG